MSLPLGTTWKTSWGSLLVLRVLSKDKEKIILRTSLASLLAQMIKNLPPMQWHWDLIPGWGRSPAKGNGNPFQYSCLENFMDRGAWWATVHGVAKSQTRLKKLAPWWSSGWNSMLQMLRMCARSLVGKLRSHIPHSVVEKYKDEILDPRKWGNPSPSHLSNCVSAVGEDDKNLYPTLST